MRIGAISFMTACAMLGFLNPAKSEDLGTVNTAFKFFGSDKIGVEAFDDPKVPGVTCYLSRARRGGITGSLGLATDTSDASLACRQTGPVTVKLDQLPDKESVFQASTSFLFKTMQVVRFLDKRRNSLVYLVYSDKLIDGSPKNAISAVSLNVGQ